MSEPAAQRSRYGGILAVAVVASICLYVASRTAELFLLLLVAVLLGIYLSAVADAVARYARLPRPVALALAIVFSLTVAAALITALIPPVIEQVRAFAASLPTTLANLDNALDAAMARVPALAAAYPPGQHRMLLGFTDWATDLATSAPLRLFGAAPKVFATLSVGIMAVYLAAAPSRYADALVEFIPPRERSFARSVLDDLGGSMRAWIVGQLINMVILGAMMAVGLKLLGVPYWLAFGAFTFVAALVPFFGSIAATLLPALVVFGMDGGSGEIVAVLALGLFVHLFEGNVLSPLVMAVQVELPPVVTMFGILVMGALFGPLGVLAAVPVIAVVSVLARRIIVERLYRSERFREPLPPPPSEPPAAPQP
jgi:predicted PurR-regulated permease PerM